MKGPTFIPFVTYIVYLQAIACLSAAKDDVSQHGTFIDFVSQPQNTVDDKLNPIILNCSIGLYSVYTNEFQKITLPANITWYKNNAQITKAERSQEQQLFSNGSFKVFPRSYRTSNSASFSTYQCRAAYKNSVLLSSKAIIKTATLGQSTQPARRSLPACAGSSIYLNCSFDIANPLPVIKWYKSGRLVASTNIEDTKRNVKSILPSGVLEITEISERDAGRYTCYAENIAGRKKGAQYVLKILNDCSSATAERHFVIKPQSQSRKVGERAVLGCAASGDSQYSIKWFRNLTELLLRSAGKFRLVGQYSLMITNLTIADSGEYFCYVYDNSSASVPSLMTSATLTVLEPTRSLQQSDHFRRAYLGCQITFSCNVTGWPLPTVVWYKNGILLTESDSVSFTNYSMTIRVMNRDDDGVVYQCFADNGFGGVQHSFQLLVLAYDSDSVGLSDVLYGDGMLRLTDSTPNSATITWSLFGLLRPTGYKIEWHDTIDDRRGVVSTAAQPRSGSLDNLKGGWTITVSVTPFTPECEGPRSKAITFTTPQQDDVPADMVRNLTVESLSSTGLWITWNPPLNRDDDIKYKIAMWETNSNPSSAKEVLTTETSQEYQGLRKYTSYSVKVAVVGESGDVGLFCPPIALKTQEDIPDEPPTNITASLEDIGSVLIRWSPPSKTSINGEIRGYNIKYKDTGSREKNTILNLDGDMTQYLLKDLRSNAEYAIRMQIRNGFGSSVWTKRIYFETSEDPKLETRAPGKPARIDTKTGSKEMMVMWAPPNDDVIVREYEIGWGETGPYEHADKTKASQRYYRITGLSPDTEYFISVRAGNKAGQGEEYHIDVRTKASDDISDELYPPLNVHVTVLTATTLNVTWHNTAKEEGARYLVRYKTNVPEEPRVRFLNSSDISCIIHGLRPYTMYDISVKLVVGDKHSAWSMTETARTKENKPSSPPTDLTVMPIEGKEEISVQLNWQPPVEPNGELDGYRVFYTARPSSKMEGWVLEPVKGDKLSTIIVGLEKNTRYYFKALARNKQGDGPYSAVVEYQTLATGQQTPDASAPFNLSKPIWYLIVGGAVLLLIIIIAIIVVVVYRKKRSKNKWNYSRGKSSSGVDLRPINGVRSSSSTSWPLSSNPVRSSMRQLPSHNKQLVELHSLHSPSSRFTQEEFPNFCSNASREVRPLTDPQYRYDYQRVPVSSPLHDPLRPPTSNNQYCLNGGNYDQESCFPLHRDISNETEHYPGYHISHRGASVNSPSVVDPTGDSAYGSDHQHCHLADNQHRDPGDVSRQNQYLQCNQRSNHQRSSSLSISACSTTGSGNFSSLDSIDPDLANVQQFVDDMRIGNNVM